MAAARRGQPGRRPPTRRTLRVPGLGPLGPRALGLLAIGVAALAAGLIRATTSTGAAPAATPPGPPALDVKGNHVVDASGTPVRLLGVDRSGSEYACVQGWGIFEGPVDQPSVAAMADWRINTVRLPLNEDCWLGINGVDPSVAGANYRKAIRNYVIRLHRRGMYVVLDLHWSAPGAISATDQSAMADADHSRDFWSSVAAYFRDDPAVVFDLFNEPNTVDWQCWRDGCTSPDGWQVAGMQSLVDSIRGAGARQPIMVGGLAWANDLSSWLAYRPDDPLGRLAASFHVYNNNHCADASCWDREVAPVAAVVPVVTGEIGENDCAHTFTDSFMGWADAHGVSYLGWTWNQWSCEGHGLITDYGGTPTPYGDGLRRHLVAVAGPR